MKNSEDFTPKNIFIYYCDQEPSFQRTRVTFWSLGTKWFKGYVDNMRGGGEEGGRGGKGDLG